MRRHRAVSTLGECVRLVSAEISKYTGKKTTNTNSPGPGANAAGDKVGVTVIRLGVTSG